MHWCRGNPSASPKVRESIGPGRLLPQLGQGISEDKRHVNPSPLGKAHPVYQKKGTQTKEMYNREKCIYQVCAKHKCILGIFMITAELVMRFNYFLPKLKYWCKSFAAKPERDILILTNRTNTVLQFLSECANSPRGSLCKGVASISRSFAVRGTGEKPLEGLKVKIREQTNTGDFMAGMCYRQSRFKKTK